MSWRNRLLNARPETVGRAMKFGGGRILSQQDLPRAGMNKGGRAAKNIGGRANLLEEMGRIDARRHPDAADRAEKHRVIGELNRGYNKGGRVGAKKGRYLDPDHKPYTKSRKVSKETIREGVQDIRGDKSTHGKVHSLLSSRKDSAKRLEKIIKKQKYFHPEKTLKKAWPKRDKGWGGKHSTKVEHNAKGGRVGAKKGGDGKWIQKVNASIKRRGTKGKCTPITKPGCTGRAKALAKTFKKMAKARKKS